MKTLHVNQTFNPEYDYTDKFDQYIYVPVKVTNSITPRIASYVSETELAEYCADDDWEVTVK